MKKILSIAIAAALCCAGFVSCEKTGDDITEGTGTETGSGNEDGENPAGGQPAAEYIADVQATTSSITFTVNSESEYGYKYAVVSEDTMKTLAAMNESDINEDLQYLMGQCLYYGGSSSAEASAIEVTKEATVFFVYGGNDITASTTYYIIATDVDEEGNFENADIKYFTAATPAE